MQKKLIKNNSFQTKDRKRDFAKFPLLTWDEKHEEKRMTWL